MNTMLLNRLQSQLEDIYAIDASYKVDDFVIHDAELASWLDQSENARTLPEKLLIHQDEDNLDLTLYLDGDLVERLEKQDPTNHLHNDNIHDFWVAIEGISHFLYVIYHAAYERKITLFELELQAEVDKYIVAIELLEQQQQYCPSASLHYHLYKKVNFDSRLLKTEFNRYYQANTLASKFSAHITKCKQQGLANQHILNTLRRFYRLTQAQKIKTIAALPN